MVYSLPEVLLYDLTIPQKTHHTRLRVGVYGGQRGRGAGMTLGSGKGKEASLQKQGLNLIALALGQGHFVGFLRNGLGH